MGTSKLPIREILAPHSRSNTFDDQLFNVSGPFNSNSEKLLFYSKKDFLAVGYSDKMINVLSSIGITKPSKVQALSYRYVYDGKNCIVADQTGSGKTLSYLIPAIQQMIDKISSKKISPVQSRSPIILIVTPTTELAFQVSRVVKTLANALKFRTACFTSSSDIDSEQKKLRLGCEILVTTPGRLLALIDRKEVTLNNLQIAVLDEADILFMDQSFPLQPIGEACSTETQFVFTTATLPTIVIEQIKSEFPDVVSLIGPGLHRIAPNIEEILIDCSGPRTQDRNLEKILDNKKAALLKSLQDVDCDRTIIFCNTIDQCRRLENILQRSDRNERVRTVLSYHGAIDSETRDKNLAIFSRALLKQPAVLICTDRASRGMDFNNAHVDHVILFDFPQEPSEYVRRVGRTGRAGRSGRVTVLVYGKQVPVAKAVLQASIDGKRIDPDIKSNSE
eukprot:gene5028-7017_t